ncbi:MAG TPA: Rrf2 family transcriptional regulator, partial [Usitatibacteraceae bacterium]|nr:Rrf2 family transcriptional regulator [Usitatibacteraceae bacterium]
TFTDYSLRVLMYVAAHPEGRTTIAEIAQSYAISEHHLTKVVHFLGKEGYLENLRGRGGGLLLAKAPAAINVGEVVRLTEGGDVPAECFQRESNTCAITADCKLKFVLADAVEAFYAELRKFTLADVVKNRKALGRVLFAGRANMPSRTRAAR